MKILCDLRDRSNLSLVVCGPEIGISKQPRCIYNVPSPELLSASREGVGAPTCSCLVRHARLCEPIPLTLNIFPQKGHSLSSSVGRRFASFGDMDKKR